MITALAVGLALADRSFDFIDGRALGFTAEDTAVMVDCYTDKGVKVVTNDLCTINPDGGWCVSVDSGPTDVSYYIVKVSPLHCLKKKFRVPVPKTGRPSLTIRRSDFVFGDLNGNNVIDPEDVLWVQEAVGIKRGDPRWTRGDVSMNLLEPVSHFDFNHDGVIDEKDVSLVRANLGKRGD